VTVRLRRRVTVQSRHQSSLTRQSLGLACINLTCQVCVCWCVRASDHPNTPPPLSSRPLFLNPMGVPKQQEAAASRLQSALISPSCHCRTKARIQLAFWGQTVGEFPCLLRSVHVVRDACAAVSFMSFRGAWRHCHRQRRAHRRG
jgi:hypothetical protein